MTMWNIGGYDFTRACDINGALLLMITPPIILIRSAVVADL